MAAPSSAYQRENIYFDGHGQGFGSRYIAKYGIAGHENVDNIKANFFLDYIIVVRKNGSNYGFIGFVQIGSSNYSKHNPDRINSYATECKIRRGGTMYHMLSDAGLNTLPAYAQFTEIGYNGNLYEGDCPFSYRIKSAYYLATSVDVSVNTYHLYIGVLDENESYSRSGQQANTTYLEGTTINATITAKNDEGTITDTASATVKPAITRYNLTKIASPSSKWDDGTACTYYIYTKDMNSVRNALPTSGSGGTYYPSVPGGGEVVANKERTSRAPEGYYTLDSQTGFHVNANGRIDTAFKPSQAPPVSLSSIILSVTPIQTYNGSAGWLGSGGWIYRMRVQARWSSGTRPNVAISFSNVVIGTSRTAGSSPEPMLLWRTSSGGQSTSAPAVSFTLPSGSSSSYSGYVYAKPSGTAPSYLRLTSYRYSPTTYQGQNINASVEVVESGL